MLAYAKFHRDIMFILLFLQNTFFPTSVVYGLRKGIFLLSCQSTVTHHPISLSHCPYVLSTNHNVLSYCSFDSTISPQWEILPVFSTKILNNYSNKWSTFMRLVLCHSCVLMHFTSSEGWLIHHTTISWHAFNYDLDISQYLVRFRLRMGH